MRQWPGTRRPRGGSMRYAHVPAAMVSCLGRRVSACRVGGGGEQGASDARESQASREVGMVTEGHRKRRPCAQGKLLEAANWGQEVAVAGKALAAGARGACTCGKQRKACGNDCLGRHSLEVQKVQASSIFCCFWNWATCRLRSRAAAWSAVPLRALDSYSCGWVEERLGRCHTQCFCVMPGAQMHALG